MVASAWNRNCTFPVRLSTEASLAESTLRPANETKGLLTFTVHQSTRSRSQAIAKAQKAADTHNTTTTTTSNSSAHHLTPQKSSPPSSTNPDNSTSWLLLHAPTATPQTPTVIQSSSAVPVKPSPTATEAAKKPIGKLTNHPVATRLAKKEKSKTP